MAIWLRREQSGFSVPGNVIRRDQWQHVLALESAFMTIDGLKKAKLLEAESAADQVRCDAHEQAKVILTRANVEAEQLFEAARENGFQSGLDGWTKEMLRYSLDAAGRLKQERSRLAQIVVAALEKILPLQDPQGVYKQVLRVLAKSIQSVRYVSVRVCPTELVAAQAEFRDLSSSSEFAKIIEVIGDERVSKGSCLVETDQGVFDLSLTTQLAALRAAIEVAIQDESSNS